MNILSTRSKRWAEGAIVYQIYPRSFYDTNNDGIGDIPGITAKLPYLKSLGVNVLWLSPFYPSPMADFGYDVANYIDVDPMFGKLSDIDDLVKAAHRKGIKIMVDIVPNHTSDEHEWFIESRKSRDNPFADWYVWKDPKGTDKDGNPIPPNNWLEIFNGKTAWEWEQSRQQFYLHSFDVKQPDLNWANPRVREVIKSAMRFWLNRGIDGFRVDAVRHMGKDPMFKDNPKNPHHKTPGYGSLIHKYSQGFPQLHSYLNEMASVLKEKKYSKSPRFMVTEAWPEGDERIEEYLAYYEGMDPEVAAPFIFEGFYLSWHAEPWRKFLGKFHPILEEFSQLAVSSYAFGNHDRERLVTRLGEPAARAVAVFLLTLPGMAFIYNGEEIGMVNGAVPKDKIHDPQAKGGEGRDPVRTPIQWSAEKNAGFSKADYTWLPVATGYETRNVESQNKDPESFLHLYRTLAKLRNNSTALRNGSFKLINVGDGPVLGFIRHVTSKYHVVLINFADHEVKVQLPAQIKVGRLQVSSNPKTTNKTVNNGAVHLRAHEAVVYSGR